MHNLVLEVKAGRSTTLDAMGRVEAEETRSAKSNRARSILGWLGVGVIAVLFFVAQVAWGQPLDQLGTAATTPTDVNVQVTAIDWNRLVFELVAGLLAVLATILTGVLLPAARRWLKAKAEEQGASTTTKLLIGATLKLDGFVEAGVAQVWHVFEADMRAAADPSSDGGSKITSAELDKAKADVLAEVKKYLGTAGLAQLSGVLGFGGEMLDSYLKAQIEKKVQAAQHAGTVAAAGVTTGQAAAAALSKL